MLKLDFAQRQIDALIGVVIRDFTRESSHGWRTHGLGCFFRARRGRGAIELSSWTAHEPFLAPLGVRRASSAFRSAADAPEKTLGAASSRLLTVLPRTVDVGQSASAEAGRPARRATLEPSGLPSDSVRCVRTLPGGLDRPWVRHEGGRLRSPRREPPHTPDPSPSTRAADAHKLTP